MKMTDQNAQILKALETKGFLTAKGAMELNPPCFRLAARVWELNTRYGKGIRKIWENHRAGATHATSWTSRG